MFTLFYIVSGVSNKLGRCWNVYGISEQYFSDDNVGTSQINSFAGTVDTNTNVHNGKTVVDEATSQRISGFIQRQVEDTAEAAAAALAAAISDVSSNEQILYFENANIPSMGSIKCKWIRPLVIISILLGPTPIFWWIMCADNALSLITADDEIDIISDGEDLIATSISKIKRANSMNDNNNISNYSSNNSDKDNVNGITNNNYNNNKNNNTNRNNNTSKIILQHRSEDGKINLSSANTNVDLYVNDEPPKALPLRPIIREPYNENDSDDGDELSVVYTEQHTEVKLNCEVDLDIAAVVWMRNGQVCRQTKKKKP